MFTTCNECGTVFRVSPAELRVAEGQVRCGHCSATFNALATLTDEPPPTTVLPQLTIPPHLERQPGRASVSAPAAATEAEPDTDTDTDTDTDPEPDTEVEAGSGQESELEPELESEPEPDISALDSITSEETLEFNIPEDNWSEFFIEDVEPEPPSAVAATATADEDEFAVEVVADETSATAARGSDIASINYVPDAWQEFLNEPPDEAEEVDEAPVYRIDSGRTNATAQSASEPACDVGPPLVATPPAQDVDSEDPVAAIEAPVYPATPDSGIEEQIDAVLGGRSFEWQPEFEAPAPAPRGRRLFGFGAVILALALVLQLIHYQRDELAARSALYQPLTRAYAALNLSLLPDWNLNAYEVRGSEAVVGATTRGALDVLARIAVVGSEPTGLPMVRVTLHDRFSKSLGSRVFTPDEYLDGISPPAQLLDPGYLIPVRVSLRDPGTDAFGYEVDVCVLYRRRGLVCQKERDQKAPFTR